MAGSANSKSKSRLDASDAVGGEEAFHDNQETSAASPDGKVVSASPLEFNEFQRAALKWAAGRKRGVVIAPPGAGKSLFITGLYSLLRNRGYGGKLLVLTKTKAMVAIDKANFVRLSVVRIQGQSDLYWLSAPESIKADIVCLSTQLLPKIVSDKRYYPKLRSFLSSVSLVVVDEIHNYRNYKAKISQALKRLTDTYSRLIDSSDGGYRFFGVTATPIIKALENWYAVFSYVEPRIFGSWWDFQARYCVLAQRTAYTGKRVYGSNGSHHVKGQIGFTEIVGYKNLEDLNSRISPYLFSWSDTDFTYGFHLVYYSLDSEEREEYNKAIRGLGLDKEYAIALRDAEGNERVVYHDRTDVMFTRSRQEAEVGQLKLGSVVLFNDVPHTVVSIADREKDATHSVRLIKAQTSVSAAKDKMRKLLDLLREGDGALVYFTYIETLEAVYRHLASSGMGKRLVVITGATQDKARVLATLSPSDIVLGTRSVIESLDFYFNRVVVYEQLTNNSIEQFLGRCSRYNSPYRHIDVYFIIRPSSVEEYFYERMRLVLKGVSTNVYSTGIPVSVSLEGVREEAVDISYLKRHLLWKPQLLD